jgi:hypothetical protein
MTRLSAFHQLMTIVGDNGMRRKVARIKEWRFESATIGKESLPDVSQ